MKVEAGFPGGPDMRWEERGVRSNVGRVDN